MGRAGRAMVPSLRPKGAFDGLTGVAFTGWMSGGGGQVGLYFGGERLVSGIADMERPDVVLAGVAGARGFSFKLADVEAALRARFDSADGEARTFEARDGEGRPLAGAQGAVSPADFLTCAALSCATQVLHTAIAGA